VDQFLAADAQDVRFRLRDRRHLLVFRLPHQRRGAGRGAGGDQQRGDLVALHHSAGPAAHQDDLLCISGDRAMSDARPPAVVFDRVSKSFGPKQVLNDVSLSVGAGEALCVLGRSGTGKSVTLKLIISLLKPDSGKIWIEQDDVTVLEGAELSRVRRKMGFLFQDAALFDSMTLFENLAV